MCKEDEIFLTRCACQTQLSGENLHGNVNSHRAPDGSQTLAGVQITWEERTCLQGVRREEREEE